MMKFRWPLLVGTAGRGDEDELRALAARITEASDRFIVPDSAAARSRMRVRAAVARAQSGTRAFGLGLSIGARPGRLALAAGLAGAVVAASAAFGLVWGRSGPSGILSPGSAEAVVLSGILQEQTQDGFVLATDEGTEKVALGPGQVILDAVGNPIPLDSLLPGQSLSVKGKRDDHQGLVVEEVHATTEVRGRVQSFSGTLLELSGERVSIGLAVTQSTAITGNVRVGSLVEVEVARDSNSNLVALKIEVEGDEEDQGRGTQPAPAAAPPAVPEPAQERSGERELQAPTIVPAEPAIAPLPSATSQSREDARPRPTETPEIEHEGYEHSPAMSPPPPPPPPPPPSSTSGETDDHVEEHESEPGH